MLHRFTIQVHVLRIDGLLIQHLVEFGTQVFHPVVPLGTSAVIAQRLNVNHSTNIGRASAVVLASDNLTFVIDDEGTSTKGINRRAFFWKEIIRAHVGSHDVHIVIECPRSTLDLKNLVACCRMRIGGTIHHLCTIHRQCSRIFRIGAFVSHHDAEATYLCINNRPERIKIATVSLNPPVIKDTISLSPMDRRRRQPHDTAGKE